jgi:hypothetical protein
MTRMPDPRFLTGRLVSPTAAVAGISRNGWTALEEVNPREEQARTIMSRERFDVLPIETDGSVNAYFHMLGWNDYSKVGRANITGEDLLPFDTQVRDVVRCLADQSRLFFFLSDASDVVGLISVVNLNRRPVKVWLFSLISEIEIRLGGFLSRHCKDEEMYALTLGRATPKYDEVKRRYRTDRDHGLELPVVEYLYFSDLVDLVIEKGLYCQLDYSRTRFKRSLGSLVELRDEVAHPARSIVREPEAVPKLWRRVQTIEDVLGRLGSPTTA